MYDLSQDSSFITDIRDKPLRRFMKPITALEDLYGVNDDILGRTILLVGLGGLYGVYDIHAFYHFAVNRVLIVEKRYATYILVSLTEFRV